MLKYDPLGRELHRHKFSPFAVFLVAMLIFGVIERTAVPLIGGYFYQNSNPVALADTWTSFVQNFIIAPTYWAYYVWLNSSLFTLFSALTASEVITISEQERACAWRKKVEASFSSKKTAIVAIFLAICFSLGVVYSINITIMPWFARGGLAHRLFASLTTIIQYYILAWILVRQVIVAYWNNDFFKNFSNDIVIQSHHPDHAGGFGILGTCASKLSLVVLASGSALMIGTLILSLAQTSYSIWFISLVILWVLYIIMVPASFGLLILPAHNAMKNYKYKLLLDLSHKIQAELLAVQNELTLDDTMLPIVKSRIDGFQSMYKFINDSMPVWPFGSTIFRRFTITSLVPIISFLASLAIDYFLK